MIDKLLKDNYITKDFRAYGKVMQVYLYPKQYVLSLMETEEYKALYEKAQRRSNKDTEIAETKANQLKANTYDVAMQLDIKVIPEKQLQRDTIQAKQDWYEYKGIYEPISINSVDDDTLHRWEVNYIRHNLVNYDAEIYKLFGKIGKWQAYVLLKKTILLRIGEVYPYLKNECDNQIQRIWEVNLTDARNFV